LIINHYNKEIVLNEILKFSKDRWVAIYSIEGIFRRYYNGKPIKFSNIKDVKNIIRKLNVRSIFSSINLYNKLENSEDLDLRNVYSTTPTIDIDSNLENWKETIKVVKEIINILNNFSIEHSIIVKWSGNGCHIHLNHKGFSKGLLMKYSSLDLAYAMVDFIIRKVEPWIIENGIKNVKLENKIDSKRVFTCPLSLHRELDVVCVCINPQEISDFSIDWIKPNSFKHFENWDDEKEGELDDLAKLAYDLIGPRTSRRYRRKYPRVDEEIMHTFDKYKHVNI